MNEFELFFRELNIPIDKLPDNYTPDGFAHQLFKSTNTNAEISYSISTNSKKDINDNNILPTIVYP